VLTSIIGVVILLGGLIFFHELGHFSVARFFGVTVEVFSLGFGKKLFRKKWGETEYCVSLIPLGGYVKLLGDDPFKPVDSSIAHKAFSTQKLYKRFLIVAAGPIANLILAIFLYMGIFSAGQPAASTKIGNVVSTSPAYVAGFRSGDKVLAVNDFKPITWNEFDEYLRDKTNQKVDVTILRNGTELKIPVTLTQVKARNPYGEEILVGGIQGISSNPVAAILGVSNAKSIAGAAGLKTGDTLVKINSQNVENFDGANQTLKSLWEPNKVVTLSFKRAEGKEVLDKTVSLTLPAKKLPENLSHFGAFELLGIFPSEVFVYKVNEKSPAEKGGLLANDRIAKIGSEVIYNFESIVDNVQKIGNAGQTVTFEIDRDGKPVLLSLKPEETTLEDPLTQEKYKKFLIGFAPFTAFKEAETTKVIISNPIELVKRSVTEAFTITWRMAVSLWKLVTGKVSVKNLGGPVLIATVAGKSLDAGWVHFFQMMALISLNLFLLNLFPVPVLDGGHLLFFVLEGIKGKPISIKAMELANQIGMFLILSLVALTLFNDISRLIKH
jgi:regulator of sigma E protease